ncbi:hypothetical protein [Turneriella parva]|nr:hypothetical protein [Turneriella parva]
MQKRRFLIIVVALGLNYCAGGVFNSNTSYSKNKQNDENHAFNEATFRGAIGEEKYNALFGGAADADLKLLLYGVGQSNAIALVNAVTDVNRISQILNAPDAVSSTKLVQLINSVDAHIREGRKYTALAEPNDTLRKIYTLVNNVDSASSIKSVILGIASQPADPQAFNAIERLALLVALTNETKNVIPKLLNAIVTPEPTYNLDTPNLLKLLRVLNETHDIARLAHLINGIDDGVPAATVGAGVVNVANLIRTLNHSGIDRVIELLNDAAVNIDHICQMMNTLSLNGIALSNSDNYAGTPDWAVPSQVHNWASYTSYSSTGNWYFTSGTGFLNFHMAPTPAAKYAVLHTKLRLLAAGTLSFNLNIESLAGGSQVSAAITGCTNDNQTRTTAGNHAISLNLSAGICHLKIIAKGSGGYIAISNIVAPGSQGADRSPAEKIAVLLNQIDVQGTGTLAQILSSAVGAGQALSSSGLTNLIALIERAHFPADLNATPRLVTLINGITNVDVLRRIVNGISPTGTRQLTEIANFLADLNKGAGFINRLYAEDTPKVFAVINALTPGATWSLIDTLDNLAADRVPHLVSFIRLVSDVSHFSTILNTLSPVHYTVRPGVSTSYLPSASGGQKLADFLSLVITGGSMTVENEIVRLSNDIAAGGGSHNLALLLSALDPNAPQASGVQRLYALVDSLKSQAWPRYNHAFDLSDGGADHTAGGDTASSGDHFGRLTTLANSLTGDGPAIMAAMVNYVDQSQFPKLTQLVATARRIKYVSDLASRLTNLELLIQAIAPADMTQMVHILNGIGDSTQNGDKPAKAIGDMFIFVDAMNRLAYHPNGSPRPIAKQLNIVQLINQVNKCGLHPASAEDHIWPKQYINELSGSCTGTGYDNWRKRATNVMLRLNNASGLAVLVGDINDLNKVILLMNGGLNEWALGRLVNLIPGEVMLVHLNNLNLPAGPPVGITGSAAPNAVERSLIYMINTMHPDDIARLVHYGTGIGRGTRWKRRVEWFGEVPYDKGYAEETDACGGEWRVGIYYGYTCYQHYKTDRRATNSGCNYYRGVGPARMAAFLNIERGFHLSFLVNKYGPRVMTAAVGCGTALTSQVIVANDLSRSGAIPPSESVTIHQLGYTHNYGASSLNACTTDYGRGTNYSRGIVHYNAGWAHGVVDWNANRRGYLPEVYLSGGFYPVWALNPHSSILDFGLIFAPNDPAPGTNLVFAGRVLDNLIYDKLGLNYGLLPSSTLPDTAASTPADCDVAPNVNPNDAGSNNAISGPWGQAPN